MRRNDLEEAIHQGRFDLREVRTALDELAVPDLIVLFGEPTRTAEWDLPDLRHWKPGDERPIFANDDPAVQQAIGRCATTRVWRGMGSGFSVVAGIISTAHPRECGWCDIPLEELLKACDWATFDGRTQTAEWLTWTRDVDGRRVNYQRRIPVTRRNRRHADFWALSKDRRDQLVARAQYEGAAA